MVLKIWRIIPKISKVVGVSNLFTLEKGNIFQNISQFVGNDKKNCWGKKKTLFIITLICAFS